MTPLSHGFVPLLADEEHGEPASFTQDPFGWLGEQVMLQQVFHGNTVLSWFVAAGIAVLAFLAFGIVKTFLVRRAESFTKRTAVQWDEAAAEVLKATNAWFLLVLAVYCGSMYLDLPPDTAIVVEKVTIIALVLQGVGWGGALLRSGLEHYRRRRMDEDPASVTTVSALTFVGRLVLWSVAVLLILDNLGVNVTALVAGLGVGGIAVALAAQNILGDLFASMSIVLDKPFVYGDFIIVGDMMGTVEKIGLKTTRIRSISGEQLVFSNTDLLSSRIRNFKRMQERRIVFSLGVTYGTPAERLEEIPGLVKAAVEESKSPAFPTAEGGDPLALEQTRFDRCHFKAFGDFSLNFETVFYVLVPDYLVYIDIQQTINLRLYREFAERGIEFAYPTQTIFVEGNGGSG